MAVLVADPVIRIADHMPARPKRTIVVVAATEWRAAVPVSARREERVVAGVETAIGLHRSGSPCRSPAVKGRTRCRMHGAASGSGARPGNRNALRDGRYSREMLEFRQTMRESAEKIALV